MFHVLIAAIVLVSGSQTTTTSAGHGTIVPGRGGTIVRAGVQVTHTTAQPPVLAFDGTKFARASSALPQYCWVPVNMNGMTVFVFTRNERPQPGCQAWTPWP